MASWLLLLNALLIYITGFSAGETVFVETGASVHLNIQREKLPYGVYLIYWKNKDLDTVVQYIVPSKEVRPHPDYKNRVDFNAETFSLTLKNMQKNDTGIYRAIAGRDEVVAEHRVSVTDAVKPPVLTIISNSSISDSCTVNFTCKGHDITLPSIYNNGRCSPEEVTSQENTLSLICSENSIICNHSNPISWKNHTADIKPLCKETSNLEDSSYHLYTVIRYVGCVILVVLALVCWCWIKHKGGKQNLDRVYEGPETLSQEQEEKESPTIYHTVG